MGNWIFDEVNTLLSTTTCVDARKQRWSMTVPFVIVDELQANLPHATANESSFERGYSATLTLHAATEATLETLIETVLTAIVGDSKVWNPSPVYDRKTYYGYCRCKIDIIKEEVITTSW